jgi:hypothetical protein
MNWMEKETLKLDIQMNMTTHEKATENVWIEVSLMSWMVVEVYGGLQRVCSRQINFCQDSGPACYQLVPETDTCIGQFVPSILPTNRTSLVSPATSFFGTKCG